MNTIDALKIYLVLAVFWGFVPQALLFGPLPGAIIQLLCIGVAVVGAWRILAYRSFKLDHRIGLSFIAYLASTASTNVVLWYFFRGAR